MPRERKCKRVNSSRATFDDFGAEDPPRLRPRRTTTICLSSDSEDDNEPVVFERRPRHWTTNINIELNGLDEALSLELQNIHTSINFEDHIQSDVDQFNLPISDMFDNDIPIECHDRTIGSTSPDSAVECIDLSSTLQNTDSRRLASTSSSSQQGEGKLLECPVCLENLNAKLIYSTFCGHIFCKECIFGVLRTTKKCPQCRKNLNKNKIHQLFL